MIVQLFLSNKWVQHFFQFRYGKSKDAFGWPDDSDELPSAQCISSNGQVSNSSVDKRTEDMTVEKYVCSFY